MTTTRPVPALPVAERFTAPQGEGQWTGTVMGFVRLVGCSVGTKVCTHCDTDFSAVNTALGGGLYHVSELLEWLQGTGVRHCCITGGEPLDRDLRPLLVALNEAGILPHVETSGTQHPEWLDPLTAQGRKPGTHAVGLEHEDARQYHGTLAWRWMPLWITVSPKPRFAYSMVEQAADELKVVAGGLGDGPGWPTVEDAVRWAAENEQRPVFWQPRNDRLDINAAAMREAIATVTAHPTLRLSAQGHKYWRTR